MNWWMDEGQGKGMAGSVVQAKRHQRNSPGRNEEDDSDDENDDDGPSAETDMTHARNWPRLG